MQVTKWTLPGGRQVAMVVGCGHCSCFDCTPGGYWKLIDPATLEQTTVNSIRAQSSCFLTGPCEDSVEEIERPFRYDKGTL